MKTIRVTFRATFRQPLGVLNPSGFRMSAICPVEVFGEHDSWYAREIATAKRVVYEKLGRFPGPDSGKDLVRQSFEEQVQPWQIWGTPPDTDVVQQERMLSPGEICDLGDGKWGWYTAEDHTHISAPGSVYQNTNKHRAACGAEVSPRLMVSTKANIEPTCPACADVYRREYATK